MTPAQHASSHGADLAQDEGQDGASKSYVEAAFEKAKKVGPLFYLTVVIPTLLAVFYFGFAASDIYVSESKFVVQNPEKPSVNGLGGLLGSSSWSGEGTEVYAARAYVQSRSAMNDLNQQHALEESFGAKSIFLFDRFDPFGVEGSNESLYKYYMDKVAIDYDSSSSIVTLSVRAFDPEDAYRFNAFLLKRSEGLINRLTQRAQADVIRVAEKEVERANEKVRTTAMALAEFRNSSGILDPEQQASAQLEMISKLQDELISTKMQLSQYRQLAPENPKISVLEATARDLASQIAEETSKTVKGRESLAGSAVQYQHLLLDNQFAEKQLAATMSAYEEARSDTLRQQAYVERIVAPNVPDEALEPRRLRGILSTLALGFATWGILTMLIAGIREHQD
ncbi:hypothetical protein [Novosphingobium profundi]|uniref:hypothetical protein n=1 Tax=Novosphingobium profundi TaxID=1774954 RepID=UPI001CFC472D|nr:hypothetical protein [Novosphingobium profundi]